MRPLVPPHLCRAYQPSADEAPAGEWESRSGDIRSRRIGNGGREWVDSPLGEVLLSHPEGLLRVGHLAAPAKRSTTPAPGITKCAAKRWKRARCLAHFPHRSAPRP